MKTHVTPSVDEIRDAVASVADPELPPVTIGMLGMIHDVRVDGGAVEVELLPTFSGCPATEMIERDVRDAVTGLDGVEDLTIRFRFDPPWTADRISDEGHERLRSFGIAPPTGSGAVSDVRSEGRRSLPVMAARPERGADDPRPCPYCGSEQTAQESPFGPTPCRDIRFCGSCNQPFEAFKNL